MKQFFEKAWMLIAIMLAMGLVLLVGVMLSVSQKVVDKCDRFISGYDQS